MLFLSFFLFLVGIAILWFSSEIVIRNIGPIAKFFGVKELVVTILGVSVLSSLPELSVSAFSAAKGNADISIGNVIGSNFVTLTFVTALCAFIVPLSIKPEIKDRESSWMILSTVIILLLASDKQLSRADGVILILLYIPYIFSVIKEAKNDTTPHVEENKDSTTDKKKNKIWLNFLLEIVAIVGVIIGADIALNNGQKFGEMLGIPPLALGAILFAFGTSLPELAIAVSATLKKKAEITLGEIYSSNIFTALVVLGICSVIAPLNLADMAILNFDIPFLIFAGVLVQLFITTGLKFSRIEAFLILILYVVFVLNHVIPGGIPIKF
ncbi:MAG: hypothetical protein A2086_16550 [Spirochaetes bacterium GWD1_27_9]|nr:MAG: hypothetical protein A2Y34_09890 [Spirochaetes bacterium GWC1_27_15]OHD29203.1 MAG: hypothetical protein A2086_16550 [Spirochaetes bacterium GWD1_27_9]